MPIEVKELIIRASVEGAPNPGAAHPLPGSSRARGAVDQEAVIAAAVREVLRILRARKER